MVWHDVTYSEIHSRLAFQDSKEEIMSVHCWLTHCFILFLGHKAWRVSVYDSHTRLTCTRCTRAHTQLTCTPCSHTHTHTHTHTPFHRPLCLSQPVRRQRLKTTHKWQKMPIDTAASIDKSCVCCVDASEFFWNQEVCHSDWQDVGWCSRWCLNCAFRGHSPLK